jgi:hypothetical protein
VIDRIKFLRVCLWLIAATIGGLVVAVSVMPDPPAALLTDDKVAHALAYAVLVQSVLLAGVWAPGLGVGRWPRGGATVVCVAIAAGAVIETLQGGYLGRSAETADALANAVGAAAGALTWRGLRIFVRT